MAFVGFDITRLEKLADDVQADGRALQRMSSDLGRLMGDAADALGRPAAVGNALPAGPGAPGGPGGLPPQLDAMAVSTRRRCTHLVACESLADAGFQVDASLAFDDAAPPEAAKIKAAVDAVNALKGKDTGANGNQDDLRDIANLLKGLTPAEADAFMAAVPADALKNFHDEAKNSDSPWYEPWQHNGLPRWEWIDATGNLLSKVARPHWKKLQDAFPGVQPPFDSTDGALGGAAWHYGEVPNPIFQDSDGDGRPDVSKSELRQGSIGDCWYLAALTASAAVNPGFVQSGVHQNPNGTVSVRTYDGEGNIHWVTVTPDLPLDASNSPVGATGQRYSGGTAQGPMVLWPSYYEKAFAVAYGGDGGGAPDDRAGDPDFDKAEQDSYGAIEWDYANAGPPYITGKSSDGIANNLDSVRKAFESGHPVIVATNEKVPDIAKDQQSAYVTRHVFYVKGFDADGKVILGNPWGGDAPDIHVNADDFQKGFGDPQSLQLSP